ncbi:MAG: cysteine--tRNA ligase, partial [Gammaproteobacteria bacterium]|nr:cysteine--tRNA ligase [Gammaproteobacteria bacterium]
DDFNTALALPVLFELAREINKEKELNPAKASELAAVLVKLGEVLGILQGDAETFLQAGGSDDDVAEIEALIEKRNQARVNKDWAAADEARAALTAKGIVVEDKNGVTSWRRG